MALLLFFVQNLQKAFFLTFTRAENIASIKLLQEEYSIVHFLVSHLRLV